MSQTPSTQEFSQKSATPHGRGAHGDRRPEAPVMRRELARPSPRSLWTSRAKNERREEVYTPIGHRHPECDVRIPTDEENEHAPNDDVHGGRACHAPSFFVSSLGHLNGI